MKNPLIVRPTGLKGNEKINRMVELMGNTSLNEDIKNSAIELTKMGPDGKVYGIVREGHEYYIKVTNKKSNLINEDFNYIGGLGNKKSEAYPTYAKAIKKLNLKFISLNEAHDKSDKYNVFEDDNLLTESIAVYHEGGNGFSNEGNLEGNEPLLEEEVALTELEETIDGMINGSEEVPPYEGPENYMDNQVTEGDDKNNPWAICTESVGREDKEKFEKCVMDVKKQNNIKESKKGFSIATALEKMDSIIGEDITDKLSDILGSLTESEKEVLLNTLKKKV